MSGAQARLVATAQGCSALMFRRTGFRALIDVSPIFEQTLIRGLALNCESLQQSLQSERQQQHQHLRRMSSES